MRKENAIIKVIILENFLIGYPEVIFLNGLCANRLANVSLFFDADGLKRSWGGGCKQK
ncbi:hypothetical protein [Halobacillus karajensis]|uniref:hypothetical protein n=1 Tax=Halobacillus karajensis TaxID=195088 RepID=UPI000AF19AB1|nr:hypothetical protein [Halobacillus karajensis]